MLETQAKAHTILQGQHNRIAILSYNPTSVYNWHDKHRNVLTQRDARLPGEIKIHLV